LALALLSESNLLLQIDGQEHYTSLLLVYFHPPSYMDDTSGQLVKQVNSLEDRSTTETRLRLQRTMISNGMSYNNPIAQPDVNSKENSEPNKPK
jgi:hypothetical protein